jgi:hypothetical protein
VEPIEGEVEDVVASFRPQPARKKKQTTMAKTFGGDHRGLGGSWFNQWLIGGSQR